MYDTMRENTSGRGPGAAVPDEVRGWNWGAFLLTWIWGLGNNVLIALLTLVPVVGLVMWIVLGVKGSEWAWQHKRWDSVEHFRRVQRSWAKWGVIVLVATCVLAVVFACTIFFVIIAAMENTLPYRTAIDHLHANTAAMERLGAPVSAGLPTGAINTHDEAGDVHFEITVHGSKKTGVLHVDGERTDGQWHYQRMDVVVDGDRIDLDNGGDAAPGQQR